MGIATVPRASGSDDARRRVLAMTGPLDMETKASAEEAKKLIEEIKLLIERKGLNVELVEKESDVTGQTMGCSRCTIMACMIG
jgi:nucleotide-binding universal stress UspA family protein